MFEDFIANNFTLDQVEYCIRIILACICGACIGYERTRRQKEAGIRTHIILCMGTAIILIVSKYGFMDIIGKFEGLDADGARVASNIIPGVGFLGAGVIFVRSGSVRGLTTAAGIFTTVAIGMAIGSGLYVIGLVSTVLLLLIQVLLHTFVPATEAMETAELYVKLKNHDDAVSLIKKQLADCNIIISSLKMKKSENELEIRFFIRIYKEYSLQSIIDILSDNPSVIEVSTAF